MRSVILRAKTQWHLYETMGDFNSIVHGSFRVRWPLAVTKTRVPTMSHLRPTGGVLLFAVYSEHCEAFGPETQYLPTPPPPSTSLKLTSKICLPFYYVVIVLVINKFKYNSQIFLNFKVLRAKRNGKQNAKRKTVRGRVFLLYFLFPMKIKYYMRCPALPLPGIRWRNITWAEGAFYF